MFTAFPVEDRGPSRISRPDSAVSSAFDPTFNYEFRTGYAITNPRELIHQYATTTPAAVMEVGDYCDRAQQQAQLGGVGGGDTVITEKYKKKTTTTTTTTSAADDERFVPYAPYRGTTQVAKPNQFVRQLRDETMTDSQRDANKQHEPRNQSLDPQKVSDIKRNVITRSGRQDEIDSLTQQMLVGLQTGHPTPPRYG